ncbi:hypothetical protein [Paraburkholderia sp. SOS3]|uniref:hypothetical protein n=1 Tax=Paraburkholderia sp. SOS3 TaxID=1926494 RepID=UPI0009474BA0|nr:hypothetical protein [Paraburkholderia sp. SOS3]APR34323.1 hypothetical protein BTO02_01660 [Paraburkholderia sp. SOS3]
MARTINDVFRVFAAFPRVLRRRRARGGLTHEQFKDACLILQICVFVHCFVPASLWWARSHDDDPMNWMNWLGVAMAIALVVFFWWFLLKQAYKALENAVAREIQ